MKPISKLTEKQLARFWSKVDKRGICWEWTGCLTNKGYGQIRINRVAYLTHRVSYSIANEDPGKLCVCHTCDNPKCVNPSHLWLGTHQDNVNDCVEKGRANMGENHSHAVLSENDAKEILKLKDTTSTTIVERFGVSARCIRDIQLGETWKHLEGSRRKRKKTATGVTGVRTHAGKYQASVTVGKQRQHLGTFDTIEGAAEAVRKARDD